MGFRAGEGRSGFSPKSIDAFWVLEQRVSVLESLGLSDLEKLTRRRIFQTAAYQYCLARKYGYKNETIQLKKCLQELANQEISGLSGQYLLLHRLSRLTSAAPGLYYFVRRLWGNG